MIARALMAAACAWLVPGLGHLVIGRRAKALYLGGLVLGKVGQQGHIIDVLSVVVGDDRGGGCRPLPQKNR